MFWFFIFFDKEEGLVTLEFHVWNKILTNNINGYRHHLRGCNQVNTLENNDALIHIPKRSPTLLNCQLKERSSRFLRKMSGLQPTAASIQCPQNCKDYSWAMKNSKLVKLGAFLSKMKNELIVKNLVDFVDMSFERNI